ncbi:hypothetical protein LRS10_16915 [Phenylobacterium sp. J426]|uniref:hypothetical protein n=1 Tax=Phenylobacterium sp. J426 TaxID=2898439 RepID=UPI002150723E|nr:hypothetical protein [Phenylobacterium sp. J426]MCR5875699.1 hypothetical protein [Phenylobacterium sp. J426]
MTLAHADHEPKPDRRRAPRARQVVEVPTPPTYRAEVLGILDTLDTLLAAIAAPGARAHLLGLDSFVLAKTRKTAAAFIAQAPTASAAALAVRVLGERLQSIGGHELLTWAEGEVVKRRAPRIVRAAVLGACWVRLGEGEP